MIFNRSLEVWVETNSIFFPVSQISETRVYVLWHSINYVSNSWSIRQLTFTDIQIQRSYSTPLFEEPQILTVSSIRTIIKNLNLITFTLPLHPLNTSKYLPFFYLSIPVYDTNIDPSPVHFPPYRVDHTSPWILQTTSVCWRSSQLSSSWPQLPQHPRNSIRRIDKLISSNIYTWIQFLLIPWCRIGARNAPSGTSSRRSGAWPVWVRPNTMTRGPRWRRSTRYLGTVSRTRWSKRRWVRSYSLMRMSF